MTDFAIKRKKLALFDLDGTLFNTNEVNYLAYKEALENFGFSFEHDYWYANCIGRHYKDFLADIDITDEETLKSIHRLKKQAYKKYLNYAKENNHLFEIIELIKPNYYVVLVTTASKKNVEDILKEFDKLNTFDKIFTQEDVTKMKPDPEGYLKAMQYFDIEAEDTIIFEDSEAGLSAAKASGAYYFQVFKFND
ncbi:MAG: HAD family phosphatase [Selenomonadaceae bacterium]|nr:HAD family phosphatase [Selenomonadaceae bacterium]